MIEDSSLNFPPELSSRCQRYLDLFDQPESVTGHPVSATLPSFRRFITSHEPETKPKGIDTVLVRLSSMDFPGKGHVEEYLRHLHRYNCKSNTLRSALTACQSFLSFIEDFGKTRLEQTTRSDLEAFVEHEQDRGLAIVSVRTRLAAIYAFLRFLHDKGVVHPELLVKRIRLRLPEPLPKAIHPDDGWRLGDWGRP